MALQKLYYAEADVEARNLEKINLTSLFRRSIKNLNPNDFSSTKQVDGGSGSERKDLLWVKI